MPATCNRSSTSCATANHGPGHGVRCSPSASRPGDLGGAASAERPRRVRDPLPPDGARGDRRVPPALHAPQLQDAAGVRGILGVLGSAAIEGPVISWVADHRKHHAFADGPATPTARTSTMASACAARCGACSTRTSAGCSCTTSAAHGTATRPICSPIRSSVRRPDVLGVGGRRWRRRSGSGSRSAARGRRATGLLWGGGVRMFVLHHMTYSINSICHVFGRRRFGPRTSPATCSGCASHFRGGVAQQPPRVPDLRAARSGAGSSIPRRWSSAAWRPAAWPGTSCASARSANGASAHGADRGGA